MEEIIFWGRSDVELRVLPSRADGQPADLPSNVRVDLDLSGVTRAAIFLMILALPLHKIFYRELLSVIRAGAISFKVFRSLAVSLARTLLYRGKIIRYTRRQGPIDLLYCYWNDAQAYAACMLKQRGLVRRVISRAHGGDLYESRWPRDYVPLKWQFVQDFDALYLLSDSAARYAEETYSFPKDRIFVSPLGVLLNGKMSTRSISGHMQIVSVSSCIKVKRIDLIIEAMAVLACSHRDVRIRWTHIGDGPLWDELFAAAEQVLSSYGNLEFRFLGKLKNSDVRQFYLNNSCDVFVNASDSEGMPVTIMEAMGVGVPAVAPNVGGISELIEEGCGVLLPRRPVPTEIADAIWALHSDGDNESIRQSAAGAIRDRFNAERNYPAFIAQVDRFLQEESTV